MARALAGAGIAVAGVALGIGALLWVTEPPTGSPAVTGVQAVEDLPPEVEDPAALLPAVQPPARPSPARPAAPPGPPAPAPAPARAAPLPAVTVLNNSTVEGLADRAAARFARAGWPVRLVGNFRGRLRATTVYYEPGQRAAAQRFARTFRGVPRVLPRPANIPGPRGLTVVLTRDFPA